MTLVREFEERFAPPVRSYPPLQLDRDEVRARMRYIREEFEETMEEMSWLLAPQTPEGTVVLLRKVLKELADLRYVVEGTAVAFGLPFDEAFEAVHASNMTKSPPKAAGGKVAKGPGYLPVDMTQIIPDIQEVNEI